MLYIIYYVSVTYTHMYICYIYYICTDVVIHLTTVTVWDIRDCLLNITTGLCVCVCMYNTLPQRGDGKPIFWATSTILSHSLSRLDGCYCFLFWELTIPKADEECKQTSLSLGPLHFSAVLVKQGLMELMLKGRGDCPWIWTTKSSSFSEGVETVPVCRGSENFLRLIGELLGQKTPSPGVSSFVASRWWVLIDVGVFILSEAARSFFFL